MITELKENEIFVFGSNTLGEHIGGAAQYAVENFGAIHGIEEGLQGQSYAFPTLDWRYWVDGQLLEHSRDKLYSTARALPEKVFLLTKVGCGIAGYPEETIKELFVNPPQNIILPEDWR